MVLRGTQLPLETFTIQVYFRSSYMESLDHKVLTSLHQFAPTGLIIVISRYRKIPKISAGAYIFQSPFLRGLFLAGLIFGGAYLRREICVSKSIGLAL